jgi:hypothetical protein
MQIEFELPCNCSRRQLLKVREHIAGLLMHDIELQTLTRQAALDFGGSPVEPYRISLDLRHAPVTIESEDNVSLLDPLGRSYTRAELIAVIQFFVSPGLVDDVLINGRSWLALKD